MKSLETKIPPLIVVLFFLVLIFFLRNLLQVFTFKIYVPFFFLCLAIAFFSTGIIEFRKYKTTLNPLKPEESSALLTTGVFKFSRNPIYLSMTVILIGSSMLYNCLSVFIIPILFAVLVKIIWIDYEEAKLKKTFGEEYLNYKKKTRRWI